MLHQLFLAEHEQQSAMYLADRARHPDPGPIIRMSVYAFEYMITVGGLNLENLLEQRNDWLPSRPMWRLDPLDGNMKTWDARGQDNPSMMFYWNLVPRDLQLPPQNPGGGPTVYRGIANNGNALDFAPVANRRDRNERDAELARLRTERDHYHLMYLTALTACFEVQNLPTESRFQPFARVIADNFRNPNHLNDMLDLVNNPFTQGPHDVLGVACRTLNGLPPL